SPTRASASGSRICRSSSRCSGRWRTSTPAATAGWVSGSTSSSGWSRSWGARWRSRASGEWVPASACTSRCERGVAWRAAAGAARRPVSEEAEALALLSDLVAGSACFDVADTREYVEGAIVGLDPRLVRRLRRGDFAWQAHLDLHGMTAEAARPAVDRFLLE